MPDSRGYEAWLRQQVVRLVPEVWLSQIRAYRRSDVYRDAGVVMIHVPRAAGTSLSFELYGRFIGHFTVANFLAVAPADVKALPRFAVVRNPWDRLVSAWSFASRGYSLIEPEQDEDHSGLPSIRISQAEQYRVPEFASFERFVGEWLASRDVHRLDGVFRPQVDYVMDASGRMRLDYLGRFEKLDELSSWLSTQVGRELSLPRLNASKRGAYRQFYTPQMAKLIGDIYAKDIEAFGYEF